VLSEGQSKDWFESVFVVSLTALAAVTLLAFVVWELRAPRPAVDLTILSNSAYTSGTVLGGVLGLALFGSIFLLPQFMQGLLGYDALQSGVAMLPRSLVMMVGMPIAGRLYNRLGPRLMIGFGLSLSGVAALQMGRFTADTSYTGLVIPQVWQGLAFSFIFVSLSTAALATVARPRMTNATALYNLVRQLGGSFGIAIIATLLEKRQAMVAVTLGQHLNAYNPGFLQRQAAIAQGFAVQGIAPGEAGQKALALLGGMAQQQAAVMAFEYVFTLIGLLFIITLPLVFFMRSRKDAIPSAPVE
jgi:DHA2 family multidrug resistance protein